MFRTAFRLESGLLPASVHSDRSSKHTCTIFASIDDSTYPQILLHREFKRITNINININSNISNDIGMLKYMKNDIDMLEY